MRRWVVACGLVGALAVPAAADRLTETPEFATALPMGTRLKKKVNLLSDEVALHLNTLSLDMIDLDFDIHSRVANFRLGGGDERRFALRMKSHVLFRDGYARVNARIDLSVIGNKLTLELPEFDMLPRTWAGESYVEFRLPVFEGRF